MFHHKTAIHNFTVSPAQWEMMFLHFPVQSIIVGAQCTWGESEGNVRGGLSMTQIGFRGMRWCSSVRKNQNSNSANIEASLLKIYFSIVKILIEFIFIPNI